MNAANILIRDFRRDLSTKTAREIEHDWTGKRLEALEKISPGVFEKTLSNHNPIYYLALKIWFDNDPHLLWPPLHRDKLCSEILDYILDEDDKDHSGLLVLIQRDSFKSTFMHGVVPMWFSIREKYVHGKDVRVLMTHQREEQASLNLKRLKARCMFSPFLKRHWGDDPYRFAFAEDPGTSFKFDWPCKNQGIFHEPSVVAAGSGTRLVGLHFDLMCNDDLVDEEQIYSKVIRDRAKNRYSASRFMLDTLRGKEINSGTPYHIHDLWSTLRTAKASAGAQPLYRSLIVGAGGKHTDQELSMPNRHTQKFLDKKHEEIKAREGHDVLYWLQYQCEPRSSGMIAAEVDWLKFVSYEDMPKSMPVIVLVDPAWKGTSNQGQGSDAAIAAIGFERRDFVTLTYLLDLVVSNEMTALDGMNVIFEVMKQFGTTEVAVEEHNSHAFRTELQNEANTRGRWIHLVDLKSKFRSKNERIVTFLRRCQAGQFFIATGCRNQETFISQYEDFPQVDKNDALDVVAYSADPNVGELFAPRFNTEAQGFEWNPFPYHAVRRTRYGTL